ncbi:YsgD/CorL family protein [Raoultella ornithinolytica]
MDTPSRCWLNFLSVRNNSKGYPLMLIALAVVSDPSYPSL